MTEQIRPFACSKLGFVEVSYSSVDWSIGSGDDQQYNNGLGIKR